MIKSAAIVKTKTLSAAKELRLQKRKLKKAQTIERKAVKQVRPSPIDRQVVKVLDIVELIETVEVESPADDSPVTREEMLQQAEAIGLKVDKRWSDATLLKHIEELAWATENDNS
jgi:hypothetical protein